MASSEFSRGIAEGIKRGKEHTRKEVLDYLEARYLKRTVRKNTPEGQAILSLARDVARFLREQNSGS